MKRFSYRAATLAGTVSSGMIDAEDAAQAVILLQRQQLRPIAVEPARDGASSDSGRSGRSLPGAALAKAFLELGVLTRSGLPLDRAMTVLLENLEGNALRNSFGSAQVQVKEGQPLSATIAAQGPVFPGLAAPMIAAGEANGRLGEALTKLGQTLERTARLRQMVSSAMIYPVLLSVVAVLVVLMMLIFVIPQFEGLFESNLDQLPATTRMILALSKGVREDGLMILGALAGSFFALRALLARPAVRGWIDRRMLLWPRVGDLVRRMEAARYARVLGGLLGSGVAMPNALALAQRTISNRYMADSAAGMVARVREGASLASQISATGLFPRVVVSFVRTGEETATLPQMLDRLADVLDGEVTVALDRLVALLTPLITIVMGVIVAVLIGSIMSAIIGFNSFALE